MTRCNRCGADWTSRRWEHCRESGRVGLSLRPAAEAGSHGDSVPLQNTPDGGRVMPHSLADQLSPEAGQVQALRLAGIDPDAGSLGSSAASVLSVLSVMFLGGQHAEVARVVVGPVSVDVVDLRPGLSLGDEAVFVDLDVIIGRVPPQSDVPVVTEVPTGLTRRRYLIESKSPTGLAAPSSVHRPTGITPTPLVRSAKDRGPAVNADDIHTLIIQWSCHATFASTTAGDKHRVGEHAIYEGPSRRRCLEGPEMEALGMWSTVSPRGVLVWHGGHNKRGVAERRNPPR